MSQCNPIFASVQIKFVNHACSTSAIRLLSIFGIKKEYFVNSRREFFSLRKYLVIIAKVFDPNGQTRISDEVLITWVVSNVVLKVF